MRRFAYWLFPLIAGAVAVFIVVFMIQINPSVSSFADTPEHEENQASESPEVEGLGWIERFARIEESENLYPVNEVYLELDMGEKRLAPTYRMSVPLKDSYELFCVKQELQNRALPYFLHKEGGAMTLLVDSEDESKLAALVTKLKTYQITATVSPYSEEQ